MGLVRNVTSFFSDFPSKPKNDSNDALLLEYERYVRRHPLGLPVVPEVKMIIRSLLSEGLFVTNVPGGASMSTTRDSIIACSATRVLKKTRKTGPDVTTLEKESSGKLMPPLKRR